MTNYRRFHVPGATYFFELCLEEPGAAHLTHNIDALRQAWRRTARELPFTCLGVVVLPDMIRAVWRLPDGDCAYPERWRRIKFRFSKAVAGGTPTTSMLRKRERGLWQRRYWEHMIRDSADLWHHLELCRQSPVSEGWTFHAEDWPYSSFHRGTVHPPAPERIAA